MEFVLLKALKPFGSYNRGWFYHKEHRLWFTRVPNMEPLVKTNTYERGSYHCFDPNTFETIRKVWTYNTYFFNSFLYNYKFCNFQSILLLFVQHIIFVAG